VATVEETRENLSTTIACVQEASKSLVTNDSLFEIIQVGDDKCSFLALIDTGSPISFINASAFQKLSNSASISLKKSTHLYKTV